VLAASWLVSGYALRASRALAAYIVLILVSASLMLWFGFQPVGPSTRVVGVTRHGQPRYELVRPSKASPTVRFADSVVYGLSATVELTGVSSQPLTEGGDTVRFALRVLGPLLIGLVLISMRGRVRR
jgi:hypothetical protein